mmetsp:Transcript_52088/g.97792  ORF Transcript_52088/g.97792 Transcript_52088/m.97792 type:complete len:706 (-) Transcript_52088:67-2184(-)
MLSLTSEDVRQELESFAEGTLRKQLSEFSQAIKDGIGEDVQRIITSSLTAARLKPDDRQDAEDPPAANWENAFARISNAEKPPAVYRPANYHLVRSESERFQVSVMASGSLPGQPEPACSTPAPNLLKEPDLLARQEPSAASLASSVKLVSGKSFASSFSVEEAQNKLRKLRMVVNTDSVMANELRNKGYFHRHNAISMAEAGLQKTLNGGYAQGQMLRMDISPTYMEGDHRHMDANYFTPATAKTARRIGKLVASQGMEYVTLTLSALNAIWIALLTEEMTNSKNNSKKLSAEWKVGEYLFFIFFTIELLLRIFVFRWWFFRRYTPTGERNPHFGWNIFDFVLVTTQAMEYLLRGFIESATGAELDSLTIGKVTVLRIVRILRVGRLFRLARVLIFFQPLRVMATAIYSSFSLFIWAVLSIEIVTFVYAVYLTEMSWSRLEEHPEDTRLKELFGTLGTSRMSLLWSISGGIDWGEISEVLTRVDYLFALIPFMVYLWFVLIVVMNIVTSIFLENASETYKHETELDLVRNAYQIFKASDTNNNNTIEKADFKSSLIHPDVHQFFRAIKLDLDQAEVLFELLDISGDGKISCDEFLRGCLRLRGAAKAIDLLILSREVNQLIDGLAEITRAKQGALGENHALLEELLSKVLEQDRILHQFVKSSGPQRRAMQQSQSHSSRATADDSPKQAFTSVLPLEDNRPSSA